jgi:hypothetical protein
MTRLLAAVFRRSTRLRHAYNAGAHDQRERIRQLAAARNATYEKRRPCNCGARNCPGVLINSRAPFADLLKETRDR